MKLADAVLRGKLKTVLLSQDFDECIFLEDTFVDCHELCGWLELHGHERGDAFEGYINEELELSMAVERDVKYRRSLPRGKNNRGQIHHASSLLEKFAEMSGEQIPKDISLCIRNLIAENQELRGLLITPKEKSDPKPEMNLSTRERNSLLKVIVALCKHSEIDLDERGVAQDIANITETTGMAVGYDTIKKFVKDGKELFQ